MVAKGQEDVVKRYKYDERRKEKVNKRDAFSYGSTYYKKKREEHSYKKEKEMVSTSTSHKKLYLVLRSGVHILIRDRGKLNQKIDTLSELEYAMNCHGYFGNTNKYFRRPEVEKFACEF